LERSGVVQDLTPLTHERLKSGWKNWASEVQKKERKMRRQMDKDSAEPDTYLKPAPSRT
jgi:hypothetical protein